VRLRATVSRLVDAACQIRLDHVERRVGEVAHGHEVVDALRLHAENPDVLAGQPGTIRDGEFAPEMASPWVLSGLSCQDPARAARAAPRRRADERHDNVSSPLGSKET
jgi:hypothetical protein